MNFQLYFHASCRLPNPSAQPRLPTRLPLRLVHSNNTASCSLVCGIEEQQSCFFCCCRSVLQSCKTWMHLYSDFRKMRQMMAVTSHALHITRYHEHTLAYIITQYSVDIHGSHWIWLFLVPPRRWNIPGKRGKDEKKWNGTCYVRRHALMCLDVRRMLGPEVW